MKKVSVFSCALIALVSVSCQKMSSSADNASKEVRTVITASISDADELTKTSLDCASGKLTWSENDSIYVFAADTKDLFRLNKFTIDNSSIDEGQARFTSSVDMSAGTYFAAFYGHNAGESSSERVYNGLDMLNATYGTNLSYVMFNYPYIQPYTSSGPNPKYLLMRAVGSDLHNLNFVNMSSVMKFSVKDSKAAKTLSSIKVVCDKYAISGRFYGNCAGKSGMEKTPAEYFVEYANFWCWTYTNVPGNTSIADGGTYGDAVLLSDINVNLTTSEQYFYVVIAGGDTSGKANHGKITVTFTPTEGDPIVKTMKSFVAERGKMYKFDTVDFGED